MKYKLKYFFQKFTFLKSYFSPFKPIKPVFYIGKIKRGVPYFYPRRWVKMTEEDILKKFEEKNHISNKYRTIESFREYYKNYKKAIPKRIGFDIVELGWKTKWDDTDYRFEYSPIWSFVFWKWQITITWVAPTLDHYWVSWLYYHYNTDKKLSKKERIEICKKENPQIWNNTYKGETTSINYYTKILKKKYL